MKKILSVLICIAMLLTGFAFAEGSEIALSNLTITASDGSVLDFSGIDLKLAAAGDDAGAGLRLAVGANGKDVLSGVAALDEQGVVLSLDGLSSSYVIPLEDVMLALMSDPDLQQMMQLISTLDFTEEDLAELIAVFEAYGAAIEAGITEVGTEEIDGVTYQHYELVYGEEVADAFYRGLVNLLDKHPAFVSFLLEGTGFSTIGEVYDALGLRLRMEGEALANESEVELNLSGYATSNESDEEEQINAYAYVTTGADAEAGVEMVDMTLSMSEIEDEEYIGLFEINGCITTVTETGELAAFDGYLIAPDYNDEWDGLVFGLYSPVMTGTDLWQISIGDWQETFVFDVSFGTSEGVDGVYGLLNSDEVQMSFYSEMQDGAGEIGLAVADEEFGLEILADVAVTDTDGAWMNVDTSNTVNILTITEEQIEAVTMEAMVVLMNALSEISAANDTVAMLIGGLMG